MAFFGTNGVRGIANEYITPQLAIDVARSLGTYMGSKGVVAIGRDTRASGEMLKSAAIAGALSAGLTVIDIGICPTPSVQYYVKEYADAGIVVTASHNPREYNGIKLIASDGSEMSREGEREIEKIYYSKEFNAASWEKTGDLRHDSNANAFYLEGIINSVDYELIREKKFKVVTDTGCGAGSTTLPFLLQKLGCEVITINGQVDGNFPWRNPEPTPDVLTELADIVKKTGANMGVAQDGDADRAVFFDENGNFIEEEIQLAMMAKYVLARKKGPIVTPVSSSSRMLDVAKEAGIELVWTAVGSINVARKMMEVGAVFGGEGNGGLIFPEHQYCRDGAMACAKFLEIIANGQKISELAQSVPEYCNSKTKIRIKDSTATMEKVKKEVLAGDNEVDTTDGVKVWYDDGWVLIRPSGTEPIIRIFAESKTEERADALMNEGVELVNKSK
ncbi:MAG: phosphomannomutase / phosphoglucomutase [Methanolobus sp.]|jgi:phosphomannomutase/phosphoglucomutase|uniref:phosphoglucosamine mutase n=1 Tax=Methanolobus sp. TaxID=1874737 RepID=UPI00258F12EB|nr:phosphoglucosamine mutase [Methanolobus sp.]MDK2824838.1 phosphomannomutase / phosphoglucomutase [Methanolobus sp.]MDK2832793.1 phosphomannomutase / phosphoglucomutase [Methanolobus sp.]MDK2948632.1 phosphomannomutase / phosphoglucomutase [Methanolobus sp.]